MWNYNYYLIIESQNDENIEPVGIGFKSIKIQNNETNDYISINDEKVQNKLLGDFSKIICENGITHDGLIHKFIDKIGSGNNEKHNILVMEIEKCEGEYKERLEKACNVITSVKNAWVLENTYTSNWKTSGFDAMSNEVFIKSVQFSVEDIKKIELSEDIAKEKAKIAVSKLF